MPTERGKLLELAKRCEAAEGPDGELDAGIDAAVNNRRRWSTGMTVPANEADHYEIPEDFATTRDLFAGVPLMRAEHPHGEYARGPHDRVVLKNPNRRYSPSYTASIDVAVTLVPEGWTWAYLDGTALVRKVDSLVHRSAGAATPALALTAAALRARSENHHAD